MHRFLICVMVVSILVLAQNVVDVSPASSSLGVPLENIEEGWRATDSGTATTSMTRSAATFLLWTGLWGLTVAGNRPTRPKSMAQVE